VADNDSEFLAVIARCLEALGYEVLTAITAVEARAVLDAGNVHLAILDTRLDDDTDSDDMTGITLARQSAPTVPKIVWSAFPSFDLVRAALGRTTGPPAAIAFLPKTDGLEVLVESVRQILQSSPNKL